METASFSVSGITGDDSAVKLKNALLALSGVSKATLDQAAFKFFVTFDPETTSIDVIRGTISANGYWVK